MITSIFWRESIPVPIALRSYTLWGALLRNTAEHPCTRVKCPISHTNLCLWKNVVYQITCNKCNQLYFGSTHVSSMIALENIDLNNKNYFVKKHIPTCETKNCKGIEIKTIVQEKDPPNVQLFEAFYIGKHRPALNWPFVLMIIFNSKIR